MYKFKPFHFNFNFLNLNFKNDLMRIHFIAIGGSAMHNLALALNNKGYRVTGSDDTIFEPSKSNCPTPPSNMNCPGLIISILLPSFNSFCAVELARI